MVRLRTRYFDDKLDEQIGLGCRQVVILGAGLDTRAVRKHAPSVAYFEIENSSTIAFKKARLTESGIKARATMLPTVSFGFSRQMASNLTFRPISYGKATPCI